MALPLMETETTEVGSTNNPVLKAVVSPWKYVDEPPETLGGIISGILGYDPQMIRSGTTTAPSPAALEYYEDLMSRVLGYVLVPTVSPHVQQALDEIDAGLATFASSVEELEEQLGDLETDGI